jgi:YHS domain-containing protein
MIIRLFVFLISVYVLYRIVKGIRHLHGGEKHNYESQTKLADGEDLVQDPVCHIYIPMSQAYKKEISGREYFFCSKECRDKYKLRNNQKI